MDLETLEQRILLHRGIPSLAEYSDFVLADVSQDFNGTGEGMPFLLGQHAGAPMPQIIAGSNVDNYLRLATDAFPNSNSIDFERAVEGASSEVHVEVDFRMQPQNGRAHGFGIAWLNTAHYSTNGMTAPPSPAFVPEEPTFNESIGVGFDIYRNQDLGEPSNNHVSLHWNGKTITQHHVPLGMLDLAGGDWIHADIVMSPGGLQSDITVILTAPDAEPVTVFDHFQIPDFEPYEGRLWLGARSGGATAHHDLDNVELIQFANVPIEPVELQFHEASYTAVENEESVNVIVTLSDVTLDPVNVEYLTIDRSARQSVDYVLTRGTLTIPAWKTWGVIRVPLLDDTLPEPGTSFAIQLANSSENAVIKQSSVIVDLVDDDDPARAGVWSELLATGEDQDVDLANGEWRHAKIVLRPMDNPPNISVTVTPGNGDSLVVVDDLTVPGLTAYEGRVWFGARSGGLTADHDLDNVTVQVVSSAGHEWNLFSENFDDVHWSHLVGSHGVPPGPLTVNEGQARFLRMTTEQIPSNNTVTFDAKQVGAYEQLTVEFDFRITPKTGRADGFGFAWLNVDDFGTHGIVAPPEPFYVPEDPSFVGSVAVGFDVYANADLGDPGNNHVSVHYNGVTLTQTEIPRPIVPIHMALLPTGDVLLWDRIGTAQLWDVSSASFADAARPGFDEFCAGHVLLPDGRLFVSGGHELDIDGVGRPDTAVYDPFTDSWESLVDMNGSRWYPTNTLLPNGDVLTIAGSLDDNFTSNSIPQVFNVDTNTYRDLTQAKRDLPLYPWSHVGPSGEVFISGPDPQSLYLNVEGDGAWTDVAKSNYGYRNYGSSVMYDVGKVLIVGGNPPEHGLQFPTRTSEVIDLNDAQPHWQFIEAMSFGRRQHNTTVLPDGSVLVTGGHSSPGFSDATVPVFAPELWSPKTGRWTPLQAMKKPRLYHSVALLLPDGRVAVGGGGQPYATGGDLDHPDIELYSPPYLHQGSRPQVSDLPTLVRYGESFSITSPDASTIADVTLISLPAVTHGFSQTQRFTRLHFEIRGDASVAAVAPSRAEEAPPGWYMLFVVDGNGTPSVAEMIQLVPDGNQSIWTNAVNSLDVNADGHVSPIDVLLVVNEINTPTIIDDLSRLPEPPPTHSTRPPFFDVNADGFVSAIDALLIINELNRRLSQTPAVAVKSTVTRSASFRQTDTDTKNEVTDDSLSEFGPIELIDFALQDFDRLKSVDLADWVV